MSSTKKRFANIVLSAIAMGAILFYSICGGSCLYLRGAIFAIDLKYAGILYMAILILLNILKRDLFIIPFVSTGVGVELFLIGFQVRYWTFCPFCLIFGAVVIAQFFLNLDWSKKWYIVFCIIIGFLVFTLFFKGGVAPTYDFSRLNIPYFYPYS